MILMKCKHNFVRSGYGNDLICTKCGYAAKQAVMPIAEPATAPTSQPILREKIEIPFYNGSEHTRISVYKDEFLKQLSINHFGNRLGC